MSFFHFHTWVQNNISTIFTLLHLFLMSYPSEWYQFPNRTFLFSCPLFLRNKHFCSFKKAKLPIGSLLWHFHVFMYYILNWFIPSILPFYLSLLLMIISRSLIILYSSLYRKYIISIHLFLLSSFTLLFPWVPFP
jgi:hypothetical protein